MTDKVQKIREEVERLKGWNNNVRNSTRHMTLQEEDFNRGKHSSYIEILDFIDSLQEKPVSEDLEEAARSYSNNLDNIYGSIGEQTRNAFKAGAKWQEEQMIAKAIGGYVIEDIEEGNGDFLLSAEYLPKSMGLKDQQKVKVIVIKED